MAVYAIKMTKLEVNEEFIMKYEVNQSSMNSLSFIVFHYYLKRGLDVSYYTMFNAKIKTLHCIVFSLKMLYSNQ